MIRLLRKPKAPKPTSLPGFDSEYYLRQNRDVAEAGRDPLSHFLEHGWREGRNPSAHFDLAAYTSEHPDVAAADINPYLHFLDHGLKEGRLLGETRAKLDAVSRDLREAQEREVSATRLADRRAGLLRASQISSATAIAALKAGEARIGQLERDLDEARKDAAAQAVDARARVSAETRLKAWAALFERQAKATALSRLPSREGRSADLLLTTLGGADALTLVDLFHRTAGIPGDVLVVAHGDAFVPELLEHEIDGDERKVCVAIVTRPIGGTAEEADLGDAHHEPAGPRSGRWSDRRRLFSGPLDQFLDSDVMTARVSLARIDLDSYAITKWVLQATDELMPPGGFVVVGRDGGSREGVNRAVAEFLDARPETWIRETPALAVVGLSILGKVA